MSAESVHAGEAPIVRLHLRSTIEHVSHVAIEEYCLRTDGTGWAGVGWGLWDGSPRLGWDEYEARMSAKGEAVNHSVRLLHDLPVWTRRRDGSYWLGEISGPWEYHGDDVADSLDMFNLRPCRWSLVGTEDSVPGKIVNNFRASRTADPVSDGGAARYTRRLHAQLVGSAEVHRAVDLREVVGSVLGASDLEDLVAVYLQDRHDLLVVSRGRSTPGYEYVLRHRESGRRAVASVKSGGDAVDLDRLPADGDVDAYTYAVSERVVGAPRDDVTMITTDQLVEFIAERRAILPDQVARWAA